MPQGACEGTLQSGEHYTAIEGEDRILMPNLPHLHGLRHCWCWEARPRPYLPTWSFAKVPRIQVPLEENARLLSIYMRPWTLRENKSSRRNPLLSVWEKCEKREVEARPLWIDLPPDATGSAQEAAIARPVKRRMQRKESDPYKYRDNIKKRIDNAASENGGRDEGRVKKQRKLL